MNEQSPNIIYCTKCGARNREGNSFCTECGKPISLVLQDPGKKKTAAPQRAAAPQQSTTTQYASPQTFEEKKTDNRKAFIWLALLSAVLVLVGILLVTFLPKKTVDFPSLSDLLPHNPPVTDEPALPTIAPRQELTMMGDWGWELEDGLLTIRGTGPMDDFPWDGSPWEDYADSVTGIYVSDGITRIGDWAFKNCTNALSVRLPEGLTSIGTSAFEYCANLPAVELPSTLEQIGTEAFCLCVELRSIEIPASVKEISGDAFFCSGLQEIRVTEGNTAYAVENNVLYTIDRKTLVLCPDDPERIDLVIPAGVETIGDYAFTQVDRLVSVEIPESVTSIGYTSFRFMRSLKTVVYAGSEAQWQQIEIGEFNESLSEATIICKKNS